MKDLSRIKDSLSHLESRYDGDNDTIPDAPVVTYADYILLTCLQDLVSVIEERGMRQSEAPQVEAECECGIASRHEEGVVSREERCLHIAVHEDGQLNRISFIKYPPKSEDDVTTFVGKPNSVIALDASHIAILRTFICELFEELL